MTNQEFIRALLILGLNHRQAAKRFGMHEVHISRMARGESPINERTEIQINDALRIQELETQQ